MRFCAHVASPVRSLKKTADTSLSIIAHAQGQSFKIICIVFTERFHNNGKLRNRSARDSRSIDSSEELAVSRGKLVAILAFNSPEVLRVRSGKWKCHIMYVFVSVLLHERGDVSHPHDDGSTFSVNDKRYIVFVSVCSRHKIIPQCRAWLSPYVARYPSMKSSL